MLTPRLVMVLLAMLVTGSILDADEIVLLNGDKLQGHVILTDQGKVIFEHDVLGRLTLSQEQVTRIVKERDAKKNQSTQTTVSTAPAQVQQAAVPQEISLTPKRKSWFGRFRKDWDSQFEAGASVKRGNTDNANIYLRFKTSVNKNNHKWQIDAAYCRDQSNRALTQNEFTAGVRHEWLFKKTPWALFAQGRYDYDDFESWDYRVNGALGFEYQWIKTDALNVKLNMGGGGVKEFGSNNSSARPELLGGINFKWQMTKNQKFAAASTFFPELLDVGEYRLLSSAQWILALNTLDKVSLKIGLSNEYQSNLGPGFKKNDFKLYSALVFKF